MTDTPECLALREDLAALIEDTLSDAQRDHVVQCDACRDLRHELRKDVNAVNQAGGDYRHPDDFEAKVLRAAEGKLFVLESAMPAPSKPSEEDPSAKSQNKSSALAFAKTEEQPVTAPSAGRLSDKREGPTSDAVDSNVRSMESAIARKGGGKNVGPLMALVGIAAAAAMIPLAVRAVRSRGTEATGEQAQEQAGKRGWSGQIAMVSRAAADSTGGLEVRAPGQANFVVLAQGGTVAAGSELRTDDRTRARIDLADGTRLVLDRGTGLRLDGAHARTAALLRGAMMADVSHLATAPSAKLTLPTGVVTVLGTRLLLTASEDRGTVLVTRGTVRVEGQAGAPVEVKTGMESVFGRASAPQVATAVNLASRVSWSERGESTEAPEQDSAVTGLGELRARRPGQSQEQDHAVSLVAHRVKVRIVGNLARTEIEEVFRNDTGNELEGIYRFPLPPEAQIERLALDVNGEMEQGAFVDRQRAAAIWRGVIRNAVRPMQQRVESEDLVWVPGPWRDPALLEWQRGGRFELRIFPIPARGNRRVSIAYTQTIAPGAGGLRRYVYPLAHDANGSTRVEQFDVDVQVQGHDSAAGVRPRGYALSPDSTGANTPERARLTFSQGAFVPAGDLVIEYALPNRDAVATAWAFRPENSQPVVPTVPATPAPTGTPPSVPDDRAYVALALRPVLPQWTDSRPRDYALVVDTSRSMVGERMVRAARLAREMVSQMDPRDRVTVLACDANCREISGSVRFAGARAAQQVQEFLAAEQPAGGTDLVAQVRAAARAIPRDSARDLRIVYIGDGGASLGYRRPDRVAEEVHAAMPPGRATLTAVAIGVDSDSTMLGAMARAGGGVIAPYVPGESVRSAGLSVLEATYGVTLREPSLVLPEGLTEVAPTKLSTLRAGGELLVVGRMRGESLRGDAILRGTVAGEPFEARIPLDVRVTSDRGNAFVPRLFAAARIAELESNGGNNAREEIVRLSQTFRVASRYTSLLVLESDRMYRAFGVSRNLAPEADWTGEEASISTATQNTPAQHSAQAEPTVLERNPMQAQAIGSLGALDRLAEASSEAQNVAEAPMAGALAAAGFGGLGRAEGGSAGGHSMAARADDDDDQAPGAAGAGEEAREASAGPVADLGGSMGGGLRMATTGSGSGARVSSRASASGATGDALAQPLQNSAPPAPPAVAAGMIAPTTPMSVTTRATATPRPSAPNREPIAQQDVMRDRRGRTRAPGRWMRRIWERHAAVGAAPIADEARIRAARTALALMPDSRGRHKDFYKVLTLAGRFDEAAEVARRWSTRDALDPDALVRLAEVAARNGDRALSLRTLAGIADVRSEDKAQLERIATMFERAEDTATACAVRISLAEIAPTQDNSALAGAVRCERAAGHTASAQRWLDGLGDATRVSAIEAAILQIDQANAPSTASAVRGELTVEARWDTPVDLDLAVIDPSGTRVTWAWGRTRGLTVLNAQGRDGESLGLSRLSQTGDYVIELSRPVRNGPVVRGTITVRAMGRSSVFRVTLESHQDTQRVGGVHVTRDSRLVEVANGQPESGAQWMPL
ncbi:MAG: VIT domain-containing protein [Deltaproteobacteria bacterium]|nr:VIT domain-containing protein [Deltaproteobacteria bacterium]